MLVDVFQCTSYPNFGEQRTKDYLEQTLQTKSVILMNYYLSNLPNTLEIDLVVINRNGVYLLEVKDWWGRIHIYQDKWVHSSGDRRYSPLVSIETKVKVMHSFLRRKGWGNVSVVGFVVLSNNNEITNHTTDEAVQKILKLDQSLIDALTSGKYVFSTRCQELTSQKIDQLHKTIFVSCPVEMSRHVFGYRILRDQNRGHFIDLEAEHPEFPGHKRRIKQYDIDEIHSHDGLAKAIRHFKRDMAALLRAGSHPNLLMLDQFHPDPSSDHRYYLLVEWAQGQTLLDRIKSGPVSWPQQLYILKNVAEALAHCHKQQIIHRNLTPEAIYLIDGGQIKVGDFDFAKMPSVMPSVTLSLSKTHLSKVAQYYVAPEVLNNVHKADARSDIYSLGTVWYDMLFFNDGCDYIERKKIAHAQIPRNARNLLNCMLVEEPRRRIKSMTRVKNRLDKLPQTVT